MTCRHLKQLICDDSAIATKKKISICDDIIIANTSTLIFYRKKGGQIGNFRNIIYDDISIALRFRECSQK